MTDMYSQSCVGREYEAEDFSDVSEAADGASLRQCIKTHIEKMGFTDFAFINLQRVDTVQRALNTLPEELLHYYSENEFYNQDMVIARALHRDDPFCSSSVYDYLDYAPFVSDMTQTMQAIYTLHKQYGYNDFYHMPYQDDCTRFLLSVSVRGDCPVDFCSRITDVNYQLGKLSAAIAVAVSHRLTDLLPGERQPPCISPKALLALDILANHDITVEQLAKKLRISTVTANHHLRLARCAMQVKTNYAAIKKALAYGLIRFNHVPSAND